MAGAPPMAAIITPGSRRGVESAPPSACALGRGDFPRCTRPAHRMTASQTASRLRRQLPLAMAADAISLARRIERARHADAPAAEWERIAATLARSIEKRQARAARRPAIAYPPDLPVGERADDIARAIRDHQVVIVCGETGSGKTTQLPKICMAVGRGERGLIGHTQPRRIAARAVATRIAQELCDRNGRRGRLQGSLHRPHEARRVRQADDRRHPAGRDPGRPAARRVRHDHHRRSARAQPQHRFPAGLPEAAAAQAPGPEGDRHVGHARRRSLCPPFRRRAGTWRR